MSEPLTKAELAAMRKRCRAGDESHWWPSEFRDRAKLLAALDAAEAEIARLAVAENAVAENVTSVGFQNTWQFTGRYTESQPDRNHMDMNLYLRNLAMPNLNDQIQEAAEQSASEIVSALKSSFANAEDEFKIGGMKTVIDAKFRPVVRQVIERCEEEALEGACNLLVPDAGKPSIQERFAAMLAELEPKEDKDG